MLLLIAAIGGERLGRLRFLLGHDAAPQRAIGQFPCRRDRTIGIDVVAAMDEEIRRIAVHGSVAAHAATREVDAPALADVVARPDERDRASVGGRGAEMSNFGLAEHRAGKILKADAIENILSRWQIVEQRFGGEVRFWQRVDEYGASNFAECVAG